MAEFEIKVDPELCSGCCTCVHACPVNIEIEPLCGEGIAPKTNKVILRVINGICQILNPELCKLKSGECGLCEIVCANGALKIKKKRIK
ncbi:MAG: 4Fe-4S binding protein [Promethearchaeota archaeon]